MKIFYSFLLLSFLGFPISAFAIANPASVKCTEDGGSLAIKTDSSGGEYGECTLKNGTVCEEWAYFNGICGQKNFSDVPTNHRFSEEIKFVQEKGIVGGYTDGTFKPESTINRAEFTKIIISALYTKEEIDACDTAKFSFPDSPKNEWYAKFVCLAKKNGIINGYKDGKFLPNGTITLPEAMKIVLEANKIDINILENNSNLYRYEESGEWWVQYYNKGSELFGGNKIIAFNPYSFCSPEPYECIDINTYKISRGEMAYFIHHLDQKSSTPKIPTDCSSWFDGCNTCSVENGTLGGCTKKYCETPATPYCMIFSDPVAPTETLIIPSYENIPATCKSWFDGCNNCSVSNGKAVACTEMACYNATGKPDAKCTQF